MDESKWYFNGVFYEIYPMSFQDSNNDGIGDLEGIINRLDYLKDLGVDAIWVCAGMVSAFKDGGFDIVDYKNIDPRHGSLEIYDRYVKEAHKRNIKVIACLLFACTSDEHPWFKESLKMEKNRYSKWYIWVEYPYSIKTDSGSWMIYNADPNVERYDSYFVGWLPHQPWLNYGSPGLSKENGNDYNDPDVKALREELKSIVRFWLDRGVDGFRCDAIQGMSFAEGTGRRRDKIREEVAGFWREVRDILDSYGDKIFLAEWGTSPADAIKRYKFNMAWYLNQNSELISRIDSFSKEAFREKRFFVRKEET